MKKKVAKKNVNKMSVSTGVHILLTASIFVNAILLLIIMYLYLK